MIPYFLFIIILLWAYNTKNPIAMMLIITIFSVLRFDVGWDYDSYYQAFVDSTSADIAKLSWGPLWGWWIDFVYSHDIPFVGIGVPAIITNVFLYYSLKILHNGQKKEMAESILAYSIWPFLYLWSFCTIRQSLAMTLGLFIFALVYRRHIFPAVGLFIIAHFVHPSSFVIAALIPLVFLKKNVSFKQLLIMVALVVSTMGILSKVLTSIGLEQYIDYLSESDSFGSKISYIYALLSIICLVIQKRVEKDSDIFSKMFSLLTIGIVLNFLVYATNIPSVLSRAVSYLVVFLSPCFFYGLRKMTRSKHIQILIIAGFLAFFFVYLFITQDSPGAVSQYVPYRTIFEKI